jgi:hypothetical protein
MLVVALTPTRSQSLSSYQPSRLVSRSKVLQDSQFLGRFQVERFTVLLVYFVLAVLAATL